MAYKSKFSNLLLNPGLSYNVDEDGFNLDGRGQAQIVEPLEGSEGVQGSGVHGISKLRAQTAKLLADQDDRYLAKNISRNELEGEDQDEFFDPSLGKFLYEENSSDEADSSSESKNAKHKRKPRKGGNKAKNIRGSKSTDNINNIASDGESKEEEEEEQVEEEEDESADCEEDEGDQNETNSGFSFTDDGDYSKYGDKEEEEEGTSSEEEIEESDSVHGISLKVNRSNITTDDFDLGSSECSDDSDDYETEVTDISSNKLQSGSPIQRRKVDEFNDDNSYDWESGDEEASDDGEEGSDEDSEVEESDDEDSKVERSDDEDSDDGNVKVVNTSGVSDNEKKAAAVMKQLELFERLFEGRITLQKAVTNSHQLPLPLETPALSAAALDAADKTKEAAASLVQSLMILQEALLKSNPETQKILLNNTNAKPTRRRPPVDEDDEEITSSEDEEDDNNTNNNSSVSDRSIDCTETAPTDGKKRSADAALLQRYEGTLAKRHCALRPYRNSVVAFWEERTRLLQSHAKSSGGRGGSLSAFEETFAVLVQRLLADRDRLLKRTQLRSVRRGNMDPPIGSKPRHYKQEIDQDLDIPLAGGSAFEYYDPEIYDDTDFYSRYLEELLKSKMQRGTSNITAAQFFEMTHNLRKKNKKVVDTKRSKGRKLKYTIHSSIVGFMGMMGAPQMEDNTIDFVLQSIFGQKTTPVTDV